MKRAGRLLGAAMATLFLAAFLAPASSAPALRERLLGNYGVWRAYAYDEGGQTVCYMVTTKPAKTVRRKKRNPSYLMITHRPVEASTDVVSYGAPLLLDHRYGAKMRVGKTVFDLFSVRDTAWTRDTLTDHKLAKAITQSSSAAVAAIAAENGATIKDAFDLKGAFSAYRAINHACGLPDPAPKPAAKLHTKTRKKKTH